MTGVEHAGTFCCGRGVREALRCRAGRSAARDERLAAGLSKLTAATRLASDAGHEA